LEVSVTTKKSAAKEDARRQKSTLDLMFLRTLEPCEKKKGERIRVSDT
jgi:hypothetical protein